MHCERQGQKASRRLPSAATTGKLSLTISSEDVAAVASRPSVLQLLAEGVEDLLIVDHVQSAQLATYFGFNTRQLV